ncbi:MAG: SAM-dependent methyltransferase [Deltaproteobacteria bacterium]
MRRITLKLLSLIFCLSFIFQQLGFAQLTAELNPANYINRTQNSFPQDKFRPLHIRYLAYDSLGENFRLLLDKGDSKELKETALEESAKKLLEYFFVGIALPNESFWVNLRPDSEDNVIDDYLGKTDVGKILLEADLQLKKDTALFTSPQTPQGKAYWDRLYKKAGELFGHENVTIPTLVRPWIIPDEIIIRETTGNAYIYKATLKVMLEEDYLKSSAVYNFKDPRLKALNEYSSKLLKEIIIPRLIREINVSKRYAPLRQVYYSLILAQWFKARFTDKQEDYFRLIDSKNLTGLISKTPWTKTTYFNDYQKSFNDGEYNVKEPVYTPYGQSVRSYFSGGLDLQLNLVSSPLGPVTRTVSDKNAGSSIELISGRPGYDLAGSPAFNNKEMVAVEVTAGLAPLKVERARVINNPASPMFTAPAGSVGSSPIKAKIVGEIESRGGRIPFVDFMKEALYSPGSGYYSRQASIGKDKDFDTFAAAPYFGEAMGAQLIQMWGNMGKPDKFTVVEMGAGTGSLARRIIRYFKKTDIQAYNALEYVIIEASEKLKNEDQPMTLGGFVDKEKKVEWIGNNALDLSELKAKKGPIRGVFLSNELVDVFPVHRIRIDENGQAKEVYVTWKEGRFQDVLGEFSDPRINDHINYLRDSGVSLDKGTEIPVNLNMLAWQKQMSEALESGYIITVDYGGNPSDFIGKTESGVWSGKRQDAKIDDIYQSISEDRPLDITANVDFNMLRREGVEKNGLADLTVLNQANFIYNNLSGRLSNDQYLNLNRSMQNFKVLIQGKNSPVLTAASSPVYRPDKIDTSLIAPLPSARSVEQRPTSTTLDKTGGIDFRSLPIVAEPALNGPEMNIDVPRQLPGLNPDESWQEIQSMLQAGIIPSSERIRDYLQASCQNDDARPDIDKVIVCITEVLRLEEERCLPTESVLKELLIIAESGMPVPQMRSAISRIGIPPKEPQAAFR